MRPNGKGPGPGRVRAWPAVIDRAGANLDELAELVMDLDELAELAELVDPSELAELAELVDPSELAELAELAELERNDDNEGE